MLMCSNVLSLPMPSSAHSHYELKSCVLFLLNHGLNSDNEKDDDLCRIPISLSPVNQPKAYCCYHLTPSSQIFKSQKMKKKLVWSGPASLQSRLSHLWLSYFLTEKTCTVGPTLRHLPNPTRCHGHSGERRKGLKHGPTQREGPQKRNGIQSVSMAIVIVCDSMLQ